MLVPAANLVPLPDRVPADNGALVEPLAVGEHALQPAGQGLEDVCIIGGGPIGVGAALAARRRAASEVVEASPERRRSPERTGLTVAPPAEARCDLTEIEDTFAAYANGTSQALKTVVLPQSAAG
jgi:(R,R)-butanediol dehydrogenase/meso-butanediol dehydrogenase/diacetyl reductase